MGRLINIGFGNVINSQTVVAVVSPDSAPTERFIQHAREKGLVVDATQGRKTQGVIVTTSDYIILSALLPETIAGRMNPDRSLPQEKAGEEDEQ